MYIYFIHSLKKVAVSNSKKFISNVYTGNEMEKKINNLLRKINKLVFDKYEIVRTKKSLELKQTIPTKKGFIINSYAMLRWEIYGERILDEFYNCLQFLYWQLSTGKIYWGNNFNNNNDNEKD